MNSTKPQRTSRDYFIYSFIVLVLGIVALPLWAVVAFTALGNGLAGSGNGASALLSADFIFGLAGLVCLGLYCKGVMLLSPNKKAIGLLVPLILLLVVMTALIHPLRTFFY